MKLVAFTKEPYNGDRNNHTGFNIIQSRICENFTAIGNYSYETIFDPGILISPILGENDEE